MNKTLLFYSVYLLFFYQGYAQEIPQVDQDSTGITTLGLYNGNLAQVHLFKNTSLIFGPSMNESSMLNFYEFPVLVEYTKGKWQFYAGGQINWLLDRDSLLLGNRFGGETFGVSIPIGIRHNFSKNFFMEFKYTRNITPDNIQSPFNAGPMRKNLFELGAGYKF